MAPSKRPASAPVGEPPAAFRIARDLPLGRHRLLEAFPGVDTLPPAARLEPDAAKRAELFEGTWVELVPEDLWMYVAPRQKIKGAPRQWKPVLTPDADCIVVGESHLRESPALTLFMDIYHELCHVRQRRDGADLYDRSVGYTERWTEVEAYRFVVEEARSLRVSDAYLSDYLRVEWISDREHAALLRELGVGPPAAGGP